MHGNVIVFSLILSPQEKQGGEIRLVDKVTLWDSSILDYHKNNKNRKVSYAFNFMFI